MTASFMDRARPGLGGRIWPQLLRRMHDLDASRDYQEPDSGR